MKRLTTLGFAALALVLVGAGCDSVNLANCNAVTPWGSCIDGEGIDEALLGTWTLESQSLIAPGNTIENPFSGRELSFDVQEFEGAVYGGYFEDWSDEEGGDVSAYGFNSDCTVEGTAQGSWDAVAALDLDEESENGDYAELYELEITPAHSGGPMVRCSAGGEVEATSTAASPPLSKGPATSEGVLIYNYEVNTDWDQLIISQDNTYTGLTNRFVFTR